MGSLDNRCPLKRRADYGYSALFFCLFQHRLFNIVTSRYIKDKKQGGDDKTKLCYSNTNIAFVSIYNIYTTQFKMQCNMCKLVQKQ